MSSSYYPYYPGRSTTDFTYSSTPLILPSKTGASRAFPELCKEVTPECYLNPLLVNGHLQTAWTAKNKAAPKIHYKRRVFAAEDENFKGDFTVDYVVAASEEGLEGLKEDPTGVGHYRLPPRTTYFTDKEFNNLASEDTKPLLITLHGLSGGSFEVYLRHVIAPLVTPTEAGEAAGGLSGGDWEALVVNSRGCAGSKITTSVLYNARATWDTRQVVKWCRKTWPKRPLFAIGYSLGANILTTYLAEEGSSCTISSAVIVSNPWNLEISSMAMMRTYLGRELYSKSMGTAMRKLFETHSEQITTNAAIKAENIRKVMFLHEFDREVQCATWGYPTERAYYRDASSSDSVMGVKIPTFCLHAKDDPIASDDAVPYDEIAQNPHVVLCATGSGGHLAWYEAGGGRWFAKPIVAFFKAMAKDIDFAKIEAPEPVQKGPHGGHQTPFVFEPMRRKLHVPNSAQ